MGKTTKKLPRAENGRTSGLAISSEMGPEEIKASRNKSLDVQPPVISPGHASQGQMSTFLGGSGVFDWA